jgi:hypothetical protein
VPISATATEIPPCSLGLRGNCGGAGSQSGRHGSVSMNVELKSQTVAAGLSRAVASHAKLRKQPRKNAARQPRGRRASKRTSRQKALCSTHSRSAILFGSSPGHRTEVGGSRKPPADRRLRKPTVSPIARPNLGWECRLESQRSEALWRSDLVQCHRSAAWPMEWLNTVQPPERVACTWWSARFGQLKSNMGSMPSDLHTSAASPHARVLGLILNSRVSWHPHIAFIKPKLSTQTFALTRLTSSTWGAPFRSCHLLYTSIYNPAGDGWGLVALEPGSTSPW